MYHYAGNNPVCYTDPNGEVAFCVVTAAIGAVVGAGVAAYSSYKKTGKVDALSVVQGALIGGVTGLVFGALGAQAATSTAVQAGNCLASFAEVTGFGAASATATAATATAAGAGSAAVVTEEVASSATLAKNMIDSGIARPIQTAAHHIIAGAAKLAEPARAVLAKFGISINSAVNGVFLPANTSSANVTGATIHSTLHTKEYYEIVNQMITACTSKQEVIDTLNKIKDMLLSGEL